MTTLALEIHDTGIVAVDEAGAASDASPGYALYDGGTLITGEAAWRRAREKPRWVHHRFWQDLGDEPLGRPFPRGLSAADLAHAHLSEVWTAVGRAAFGQSTDDVLLAVPGSLSAHQLALTLGIARSVDIPVSGLVDAAVAATTVTPAAGAAAGHRLLHLDLQQHRILLTELELAAPPPALDATGFTVVRRRLELAEGYGLIAIQDAWARKVAELFVHTTRFDPLHSAATEQALYLRLPGWLEELRSEEILEARLGPEDDERAVELTRPDVIAAADPFYEHFLNLILSLKRAGDNLTVLLTDATCRLPGLESRISGLRGVTTVRLGAGAAARGAIRARHEIRSVDESEGGSLHLITRLSFEPEPEHEAAAMPAPRIEEEAPPEPEGPVPTHLLHDGLAYPITDEPFRLGLAIGEARGLNLTGQTAGISRVHCSVARTGGRPVVEDSSTYGSFLNGERIGQRAPLQAGDRLRLGTPGIEVLLIAVQDDGAADGTA